MSFFHQHLIQSVQVTTSPLLTSFSLSLASRQNMASQLVIAIFMLCSVCVVAELQRLEHHAKADGSLSFLVIGDWGRKGTYNQSDIAVQMGNVGKKLDIDFVVSTGDNFYDDGLKGVNDPAFEESFTKIYTAPSLQKQWYSVLGNHDYRGDVLVQLSPVLTRKDSRWFCMKSFILSSGVAEFFFVDTNPFVEKYFTEPKDHVYDWRGVLPRKTYVANLLKDVDMALSRSTAKWKIVVAHHPIKSAGHHGNTEEVKEQLLPILEAHEVDLYINGHDHCLEHMTSDDSPIQFLTSGGGSKAWRGDMSWENPEDIKFFYDGQGFMSAQVAEDKIDIAFYDIFGNALHKWEITKSSHSDF